MAIQHPVRRRIHESLSGLGPASVGVVARRCSIAVGSASHHLGVLHRNGWVVPAPELAADTRESWWRARHVQLSWTSDDFPVGSSQRALLEVAAREQVVLEHRSVIKWMSTADQLPSEWSHSTAASVLLPATPEEVVDLGERLSELIDAWSRDCIRYRITNPGASRRPVRVIARVFPSEWESS